MAVGPRPPSGNLLNWHHPTWMRCPTWVADPLTGFGPPGPPVAPRPPSRSGGFSLRYEEVRRGDNQQVAASLRRPLLVVSRDRRTRLARRSPDARVDRPCSATGARPSDDGDELATGAHDLQRRQIEPAPAQGEVHRSLFVRVRRRHSRSVGPRPELSGRLLRDSSMSVGRDEPSRAVDVSGAATPDTVHDR